jgi:23S rRNA (adenine2503-C2)-methyltransferase
VSYVFQGAATLPVGNRVTGVNDMLNSLLGLNTAELRSLMKDEGQPVYRGGQVAEWLYRAGTHTLEEMTNLPESLRAQLGQHWTVGRSRPVVSQRSNDGTVKLLLESADGSRIETVGLPYPDRLSCCVSTQVGCPVGCVFCATGLSGYARDLSAGEIVDQVLTMQEAMRGGATAAAKDGCRVDHVIFMGMGEPLLNYDATVRAVRLLNEELGIAMRHLSISTAGHVPGIRRLAQENLQLTLAVSLHAPTDELRRRLVPGMTRWSVADILESCREYIRVTNRRVTFEYCLLGGVNDDAVEAQELAKVLHGMNCHVNLIAFNPVKGLPFRAPSRDRIQAFRAVLEENSIQVTQRLERGSDIDAACGQLRRRSAGSHGDVG